VRISQTRGCIGGNIEREREREKRKEKIDPVALFLIEFILKVRVVRESEHSTKRSFASTVLQPEYGFLMNRPLEKNSNRNDENDKNNELRRDPREFAALIDQIALISQNVELYFKYLLTLMQVRNFQVP
jgi:hypothetical protein